MNKVLYICQKCGENYYEKDAIKVERGLIYKLACPKCKSLDNIGIMPLSLDSDKLVEEEDISKYEDEKNGEAKPKYEDEVNGEFYSTTKYLVRPSGYQFVDENGNIINAMKIVLEKKKKEYPKTYKGCCKVLGVSEFEYNHTATNVWYRHKLMATLDNLMLCRDAYWKIYGEENGLGKPWKPDYNEESYEQGSPIKYVIYYTGTSITKGQKCTPSYIFAFPTPEMRDAFYENFKKEIEECKELL